MESSSYESERNSINHIDGSPSMDQKVGMFPCGNYSSCLGFHQPAMILMISIDDVKGHGEAVGLFSKEILHYLGEEPEIANLNGDFDTICVFCCLAGICNLVKVAMAITQNEYEHFPRFEIYWCFI